MVGPCFTARVHGGGDFGVGAFAKMSSYLPVIVALVVWCFPLWKFRARGSRLGGFDQRAWPRGRNLVLAFVDAARAALGAVLMANGAGRLPIPPGGPAWMGEIWLAVAFGLALGVQSLSWRDEDHAKAPWEFALGALLVLIHPLVLLIGLPFGVGTALAIRAWSAGFIATGLGLAGVGLLVHSADWRRSLFVGLMALVPVVLSAMVGRHLGAPRR